MRCCLNLLFILWGGLFLAPTWTLAQFEFAKPPIAYHDAVSHDPVAKLQQRLDSGPQRLEFDAEHGYLPAVLNALNISTTSQVLVFSKTSLQVRHISPERPRAIYFDDETYVAWVQGGDSIEISTTDPQLGAVFYTLEQSASEQPRFVRDRGQCLTCHASSRTQGVPGHLMRSVFPDAEGQPQVGSGSFNTDPTSPFWKRWGGWYVSGTHGDMRHMGNEFIARKRDLEALDRDAGANVTDLSSRVDLGPYLTPHSDLVALMVLAHQVQVHNALTLANYETRRAIHHDHLLNQTLDRPEDYRSESTQRRISSVGERLLRALLSSEESPLTSPMRGTSGFAAHFESLESPDSMGRSLRQFDLQTRLFKYPCSFLIRSPSFASLPDPAKDYVLKRLAAILDESNDEPAFSHLTPGDRASLREMLADMQQRSGREGR